ncbi:hypothetical protein [Christiangramia sabulilitoris]|uniref:Uncharacterized protein n=1 Tax=Christiangramia sabulilitoris TaxID=2583991 RepID=A0A550I3D4_9FLAO|nr:hypothetical protein [Christiangramia sabulilitoris]TRO65494.1 hypothetical protein FGM01_08835 [Christiangramia sabulilitoris]
MDKSKFYNFLNQLDSSILLSNILKRTENSFQNVEEIYNNNLCVWYFNNSDERSVESDEFVPVNGVAKDIGKLNFSKYQDGLELTEKDFIENELSHIAKLDLSLLKKPSYKKQVKKYINLLHSKLRDDEKLPMEGGHLSIFAPGAFQLWEVLFEEWKINENSRADVSFIFEAMRRDRLIHPTVSKVNFRDWINETYEISLKKIEFTNIKQSNNRHRLSTYSNLKQAYKL